MVIVVLKAYDPDVVNGHYLTKASGTPANMLEVCEIWRQCGLEPVVDEVIDY